MVNDLGPRVSPVTTGTRTDLAAIEPAIAAERGSVSLLYQVMLMESTGAPGERRLPAAGDAPTPSGRA